MTKRYIKCAYCGNPIYEHNMCLRHEYGHKYCSYKCLAVDGFYGHYKKFKLEDSELMEEDEEFIEIE